MSAKREPKRIVIEESVLKRLLGEQQDRPPLPRTVEVQPHAVSSPPPPPAAPKVETPAPAQTEQPALETPAAPAPPPRMAGLIPQPPPQRDIPSSPRRHEPIPATGAPKAALRPTRAEPERPAEAEPETPQTLFQKGSRLFRERNYKAAAECYRRVLEEEPRNWSASYNLGLCLEHLGRPGDARKQYEAAAKLTDAPEIHLRLGVCFLLAGEAEQALKEFTRVTEQRPTDRKALFGKAAACQLLERYAEAKECYDRLLEEFSQDPELLANVAEVLVALGEYDQARRHAEQLLKIAGESGRARRVLAACASAAGDEETSARYLAQLVESNGEEGATYEVWFNLGLACQRTGHLDVAADAYRQAVEKAPDRAEAQTNLGATLHECGKLQEAVECYLAAQQQLPDHPGIHWNLGLAAEARGDFNKAERHYAIVVKAQPQWAEAQARLSRLKPIA